MSLRFSKIIKIFVVFPLLLYALLSFLFSTIKSEPNDCKEYTKQYNGGKHSFKGIPYFIEVCNLGTYENENFLILKVFDYQKKSLLVRREFSINLYIHIPFEIKIFDNGFSYFNASDFTTVEFEEVFIEIPPTWWNKFKANYTNLN